MMSRGRIFCGRLGSFRQPRAYYQGRISWEDLFPEPDPPPGTGGATPNAGEFGEGVDTSQIQSYQMREFVEALKGIADDLRAASKSSRPCMRLALLGTVS